MTSNLHQIQLTYDQVHDRILLNFSTQDFYEYRFWLSRRVLKGFWDILQQLHRGFNKGQAPPRPQTQQPQSNIKREVQIAEANKYSTRMTRRPLGEEPLLLCKISASPGENGRVQFRLEDLQGKSVEFMGDALLVSLLIQLIVKIMPITEWDLPYT